METNESGQDPKKSRMNGLVLEWVKVLGPILLSWPTVALLILILFNGAILKLFDRFSDSKGSKAEIGPIKIEFGNPVLPPQFRPKTVERIRERIDLSSEMGVIRASGPEASAVGFAIANALQAAVKTKTEQAVTLSARGILVLAKRYDEWPGEDYEGTSVLGGLKAVQEIGAYLEEDWPYASRLEPKTNSQPAFRISDYSELNDVEQILNALREKKIVIATVQVTGEFDQAGKDGKVTIRLPLRPFGGHAISIVGYDTETAEFKFANDWGTAWGANGFGFIKDTDLIKILLSAFVLVL